MFRLFINRWLFLSFAFVFSFSYAASSSYTVQGNVYRVVDYVSADANEIKLSTVVKGAAANETYAARVVPLRVSKFSGWFKPQLGSLIRANAWWAAFAGTIATAGWAIDELRNQVVSSNPYAMAGYVWYANNHNTTFHATADESILWFCANAFAGTNCQIKSRHVEASDSLGASRILFEFVYNSSGSVYWWTVNRQPCPARSQVSSCLDGFSNKQPVSDSDLNAAVVAQLAADPSYAATAFTDPATGRAYDNLFDPVPYAPGLTQSDEALVGCYRSGQLQMTNPAVLAMSPLRPNMTV